MQKPNGLNNFLSQFGQEHLLDFWSELTPAQQAELQRQIEQVDFPMITSLVLQTTNDRTWLEKASRAQAPCTANDPASVSPEVVNRERDLGGRALADGTVAVVLVAGGQGTRLGFSLPKGMLPIGPISQRTLFQILVDLLRARIKTHGGLIPLVIMTSPLTHAATVSYFAENDYLGLDPNQVEIICQGTMPAVDRQTGRVLLAGKNQLSLSPDGHGGMLQALVSSGALSRLRSQGIQRLFYGQIDNPLVQLCDPLTLGYHLVHQSEMTTQVVRKHDPLQRVGNVVLIDGRMHVIEYSDLPDTMACQRNPNGSLRLWAGNIAVHVFELSFLERVQGQATALPFHIAHKKVPFIDRQGNRVEPEHPNAIKFERFIFDLMPNAVRSIVVEVDAAEGFAPVKNSLDSSHENLRTAQAAMIAQHVRWLRGCGAQVSSDVSIEIHPLFALDQEQLCARIGSGRVFDRATYLTA